LAAEGQTALPEGLFQAIALLRAANADAALGRVRYGHGTGELSRATLRAGTTRFLDAPAGALIVSRKALADAGERVPRREWDAYWTWDLVQALERRWRVKGVPQVLAHGPALANDAAARLPMFRASEQPHADADKLILVYGAVEASVSLYFDGLPSEIRARLRYLRPGDLASDMAWLASASLVLIMRGFEPLLQSGAIDLIEEIGVPWLWFVDDDFMALSREYPSLAYYSKDAVVRFVGRAAGVVATAPSLLNALETVCGERLRRTILWPCVYDGDLAVCRRGTRSPRLRVGAYGGEFRRPFLETQILPALEGLRANRAIELVLAEGLAASRPPNDVLTIPFEPDFRSFVLRWRTLSLDAVLHPYGETTNLHAKGPGSVLTAAYLGAVPIVGQEPAYADLDEEVGVLKAGRDGADWRNCVERLRVPTLADDLFARLDAWARATFAPEHARLPFAELEAIAAPGGAAARDLRWQAACRSRAFRDSLRNRPQHQPGAEPTPQAPRQRPSPAPPDAASVASFDHVVLHCGGIGDLCLLSDLIASLKGASAGARVALICRRGLARIADLYPVPPDRIVEVDLDAAIPHSSPSSDLEQRLRRIVMQLSPIKADTLFCGDLNMPWVAWFVAAILRPRRAIVASRRPYPRDIVSQHLTNFGLAEIDFAGPPLPSIIHERERYALMLEHAGGVVHVQPAWKPRESSLNEAKAWLAAEGIAPGRYLLAVPFGNFANMAKTWSLERYEAAVAVASRRHDLALVLAGEQQRQEALMSLARRLSVQSIKVSTLVGASDLRLLAGLAACATAYVGIDTGPAHLAQAYGVPAAIVFGGDGGQHYTPWGPGSVGVMQPIPCAGCLAQCAFGSPLCLDSIPGEELTKSLDIALADPHAPPQLRFLDPLPEPTRSVIAGANQRYRAALGRISFLANAVAQARSQAHPLSPTEQAIVRRYRRANKMLQRVIDSVRRKKTGADDPASAP
jgi:ADP-heptose:LPS heptosyltransferase